MGAARLLAKAWVAFCLYAGGDALVRVFSGRIMPANATPMIIVAVVLFGAMGLLFIGGYGASSAPGGPPFLQRLKPDHIMPGFNELVFITFALLSFFVQMAYIPEHASGGLLNTLQAAIRFAVPGQGALETALGHCSLDSSRAFAGAFTWVLAFIFLGSALSRIRLAAGIVRLERKRRPEALGPTTLAFLLGVVAVVGIQFIYVGTGFVLMPCTLLGGILGDVLIGLAPLMLAYLIDAALTNLMALGPEA
jgi:hypothetical protein